MKGTEVAQSCLTLCDPVDCKLPVSSVHGIFQARILEQVAISFSRGSSWPRDGTGISCGLALASRFFTAEPPGKSSDSLQSHGLYSPWNSSGQNTGVDSRSLLQGNLPNPGIEPRSPTLQADSLPAEQSGKLKNTGVSSLSLLQRIFQAQELNWGLLHCRLVNQLSYQGSGYS